MASCHAPAKHSKPSFHHHHHHQSGVEIPAEGRKIVLVGNPNVGKSLFFNAFTGLYVDVSNFPGTTVEITHGRFGQDVIMDTPGIYGVSSFNEEERVARDVVMSADLIINVVDAVHLERDLFLTLQVIDMGIPVVIALNMMDEARRQGREIRADLLSRLLGVPVVPTVAFRREGFDQLVKSIELARPGHIDPELHQKLHQLTDRIGSQAEALLVLEGDPHVAERHGLAPLDSREEIYLARREHANQIIADVVVETKEGTSFSTRFGRAMLRPVTGIPILMAFLALMYYIIGVVVAQNIVGVTEGTLMQGYYEPWMRSLIAHVFSEQSFFGQILVGEFGILTMTVTYLVGLLLPLVIAFYLILSATEDSGYLPRLAALVDRSLTSIGLNGRAIIPIILGFGCVTMATITTRLLGSQRERTIAAFLLGFTIPCSAQLGVITGMLAAMGPKITAVYVLTIFIIFVLTGTVLNRMLPGQSTELLIDLPPLRLPRLNNVLKKTMQKTIAFMQDAGPLFVLGALIIGVLQVSGSLVVIQNALAPMTTGWLKLPKEAANAFIMGLVRRDFGAAGLSTMALTPLQTLVSLVVITLFVPCIASIMILFKERSWKEAAAIWLGSWVLAFSVGGILAQILIR